ncbi:MAG: fructose-bisphosphatase class II [Candidatus Pelagibacter sp.]|nr:fructose-bisphosphatase class II [Candidatus Pelagibacter sp.]RPG11597.1 MAG: class II fructose-bisphosphatase [Pelagibacteraceae bacterium TMED170]|tara:strand:- start:3151 stop:4092 length:942 start_codon:yes stop_codon:yes gene_type:complete
MGLNIKYLDKFTKVTEKAAYGASLHKGKEDKIAADKGAVDLMRNELNKVDIDGTIVIGEGEMDQAPMLYIGEKVGTKNGQAVDIAVDPLEGTNFVAKNLPNAFSVMAVTEKNNLFSAPDTYMEKIAIGSGLPKNLLDLDNTVEKNIILLAEAKNTMPNKLTACLLKRDRHNKIVNSLKKMDVKIKFISDGDVSGVIYVVDDKFPVDIYLGIGGGPEGVLAAAALSCLGGQIQGRLYLNEEQKIKAKKMGIIDYKKKFNIDEMIKGDVMFFATGVTNGDLIKGIKDQGEYFEASTLVLHKDSKTNKIITNKHKK